MSESHPDDNLSGSRSIRSVNQKVFSEGRSLTDFVLCNTFNSENLEPGRKELIIIPYRKQALYFLTLP